MPLLGDDKTLKRLGYKKVRSKGKNTYTKDVRVKKIKINEMQSDVQKKASGGSSRFSKSELKIARAKKYLKSQGITNAREEGKTPEVTIGLYCVKPGDSDYGITGFCNTKKAYEDLPKYRKELVNDIEVRMLTRAFMGQVPTLHPSDGGYKLSEDDPEFEVFMKKQLDKDGNEVFWNDIEEIWKPLVINHPWANSKAIRWTPSFIIDWKSKSGKEYDSLELWDYLNSHVYQDKYTYFHKWNSGDWIWMDQWTSVHNRSEVKGDRSLYRFCVDNKNIVDY